MNGKQLKNSILQWAIQGKLVPQDPNDEPASVLLERIRAEKARLVKEKKIKKDKNESIIYRGDDNSYYEKMLATGEVKCIDEEVPFEIPKGWEWCRLGEISTYAQTKRKINASNADSQLWGLDLEDIEKGGRLLDIKTVGERKAIGDKTIFNRGDILYSKLRPYLLKILVAPEGGICTPEIIPFTCYGNICKDYIVSFLKSPYVDDYINSVTFGVKMPRVSTETMTSLLVPLPPLSEQFRIDTKTKELMPYIDGYGKAQNKLNKLNEELSNTIRKSILQEAIQGKLVPQIAEEGTAQELLEQIKTEKQKLVKEGKLKKSALASSVIFRGDDNKYYEQIGKKCRDITEQIPFEIPSNWEWCRVRNVSNSYIGLTYKPTDIDEKGTIVLRSCNIRNGKLALDDIVRVSSSISEKMLIEENDIIICARNGSKRLVGKSALIRNLPEPMTFGAFMAICKTPIYEYMFAYLQSDLFFGQLRDVSNTTTINQLTQNKFNDFLIPIPPVREQERIAFKISQLFQELR